MHESKGGKCLTRIYLHRSPRGRVGAGVADTRINLSRFQNILPALSVTRFNPLDLDHPGGIIALNIHRPGKNIYLFSHYSWKQSRVLINKR